MESELTTAELGEGDVTEDDRILFVRVTSGTYNKPSWGDGEAVKNVELPPKIAVEIAEIP